MRLNMSFLKDALPLRRTVRFLRSHCTPSTHYVLCSLYKTFCFLSFFYLTDSVFSTPSLLVFPILHKFPVFTLHNCSLKLLLKQSLLLTPLFPLINLSRNGLMMTICGLYFMVEVCSFSLTSLLCH